MTTSFPVLGRKDPNVDAEYAIDARLAAVTAMRRGWPYTGGAIASAPEHTGYYYECTEAGETRWRSPTLPSVEGATVQDGSVQWTARNPTSSSLPTVASVTWEISPDSDLTVASARTESGVVYPTFSGGTAGEEYEVTAHIVWSTAMHQDLTVVIPVENR